MVLKLYGYPLATTTKRVATVLLEKKVPFELVVVDLMNGGQKDPVYVEKQPFGQIPCIDDNGFVLYESRAICRYLEVKYAHQGTKLMPSPADPEALALFEQAASVEMCHYDKPAYAAALEISWKPIIGQVPDPAVYEPLLETLESKLEVYDKILSKQKYIAGDDFSLIDIFHLPYGVLLEVNGNNVMESKPNVARWWKDITSKPSWVTASAGVKSTASY